MGIGLRLGIGIECYIQLTDKYHFCENNVKWKWMLNMVLLQ